MSPHVVPLFGGNESACPQVRVVPVTEFELTIPAKRIDIHSGGREVLDVVVAPTGIHRVNSFLSNRKTLLNKRKQCAIFVIRGVEESADMRTTAKHGSRQPKGMASFEFELSVRLARFLRRDDKGPLTEVGLYMPGRLNEHIVDEHPPLSYDGIVSWSSVDSGLFSSFLHGL